MVTVPPTFTRHRSSAPLAVMVLLCASGTPTEAAEHGQYRLVPRSPTIVLPDEPVWLRISPGQAASQPASQTAWVLPPKVRLVVQSLDDPSTRILARLPFLRHKGRRVVSPFLDAPVFLRDSAPPDTRGPRLEVDYVFDLPGRYGVTLLDEAGSVLSNSVEVVVNAPDEKARNAAALFRTPKVAWYIFTLDRKMVDEETKAILERVSKDHSDLAYGKIARALLATLAFDAAVRANDNHAGSDAFRGLASECANAAQGLPHDHPLREVLLLRHVGLLVACHQTDLAQNVLQEMDGEFPDGLSKRQRKDYALGIPKWRAKTERQ